MQPDMIHDYGTGQKTLKVYLIGLIICVALTIISFWAVMSGHFTKTGAFIIIYSSACLQFVVQVIFFLRLNVKSPQGQLNVMSLLFTGVILTSIVIGSLWIMGNLGYAMLH